MTTARLLSQKSIARLSSSGSNFGRKAGVRRLSSVSSPSCTTRNLSSVRPLLEDEDHDYDWDSDKIDPVIRRARTGLTRKLKPHFAEKQEEELSQQLAGPKTESPSELCYTGTTSIPITSKLHIITPEEDTPRGVWPAFRMMDENGKFREGNNASTPIVPNQDLAALQTSLQEEYSFYADEFQQNSLLQPATNDFPDVATKNTLLRAHLQMTRIREMDTILHNAQRQGRISFYMTCTGEEAIHFGAASALDMGDTVLAQYREAGLLMWRGFTLEQFTNQCFSNDQDLGKGRQMPVHYGSRALNYQTVSSPLGTQLPHAVGAAYQLKMQKKPNVAVVFFGDGCASTTDFHSACNFAATLKSPVIFFCRNNGFAISTPTSEQYAGDGIVSRAPGYGMAAIRVDGNDIFAVNAAVREAKSYALKHQAPVMIEAMTYRQGHHSTSDDSTRYRSAEEVQKVADDGDPLKRLEAFLCETGWLDEASIASIRDEERLAVMKAMEAAEKRPDPPVKALFEDVYDEAPPHLQEQEAKLFQHMERHPNKY